MLAVCALAALVACADDTTEGERTRTIDTGSPLVHPALAARQADFERRVVEVVDGVHVAIGFGLANSILIEGDDGIVIVDVLGTTEAARAVKAAFDEITRKPIRAIVYTHNHADHVFGGPGFFTGDEAAGVEVIAHASTESYIDRVVGILRPILSRRSARMFGTQLKPGAEGFVSCGIGPALEIRPGGTPGLIRPTRTFADRLEITVAGVELHLVHAPGETNDQIFVWLPARRVLLPGDNVYRAFPNLYTIRGTLYRDVMEWVRSLDAMRALAPEHLIPGHTSPVSGAARIDDILLAYRDAIQYVHDQTIRGMNRGRTPAELALEIRLPPHLASHPYLQELYGTVEWSVRAIFDGALGWFDGDAPHLSPVGPTERARSTIELAGGVEAVIATARGSLRDGRAAWAAELVEHVLVLEPDHVEARAVSAAALRALGHASTSANGRNYYLTQALEIERGEAIAEDPVDASVLDVLRGVPIDRFMQAMPVHLDAARAADVDTVAVFELRDRDPSAPPSTWTLHVRRGVAALAEGGTSQADLRIRADATTWKEVASGLRSPAAAYASGAVEVEGGLVDLVRFLALFR